MICVAVVPYRNSKVQAVSKLRIRYLDSGAMGIDETAVSLFVDAVPSVYNQVVLNNFGDKNASSQVKLMKVTLQNMFPSINVATVKLQDCRRVVMFNLDKANDTVEMRHYAVRATPTGITKAIKKARMQLVPQIAWCCDLALQYAQGTEHRPFPRPWQGQNSACRPHRICAVLVWFYETPEP